MVQRLARGPFKAEIRVRFPLAVPTSQENRRRLKAKPQACRHAARSSHCGAGKQALEIDHVYTIRQVAHGYLQRGAPMLLAIELCSCRCIHREIRPHSPLVEVHLAENCRAKLRTQEIQVNGAAIDFHRESASEGASQSDPQLSRRLAAHLPPQSVSLVLRRSKLARIGQSTRCVVS